MEGVTVADPARRAHTAADAATAADPADAREAVAVGVRLALVEADLREEPHAFSFFQAVRLLERLRPGRAGVGRFVDPSKEVVRFAVPPSIAFPPSEIRDLNLPEEDDAPARLSVNFMGLTGPLGVLPHHVTLLVAERRRARDTALGDFLDLFHHRMISLFYRAWEKHRFTIAREKGGEDRLRDHVLDLVGLGLESQRDGAAAPDDAFVFHAGLLAPQQRSAVALEQWLEDAFGVPAEVEQFIGAWYALPPGDRCPVGEELGPSTQLGRGAVVGDGIWDQQARVRVRLGPLTKRQFDEFLPTGSAHEPLRDLLRFFSRGELDFEVQLVLARDDVPGCVLGDAAQPLGWSTWIRTRPGTRAADETIFTI